MKQAIDEDAIDQLFTNARSYNRWAAEPISDETIQQLYDLLKLGPTSANSSPARFVFVKSEAAKRKLIACVAPGNVIKVEQAPVTVVIGMDEKFYEKMPFLFPQKPEMGELLANPAVKPAHLLRNASLQGAYLMIAARALGLDCGPMSGFDHERLDGVFFHGTSIRSNFICALGRGTEEYLFPRNPRLSFDQSCSIK
jgi:3-hydroxypropanoate dehydrogenase